MSFRIGQLLGEYRLIQFLGKGSYAEVFLGEHRYIGTRDAIKVLHTRLIDQEESFIREARQIANLSHPNIVRVRNFAIDRQGDQPIPYLVMDYAPYGTLLQRHPRGSRLTSQEIISYVKQIASALDYAHAHRIVHRDVKPENILIGQNNTLMLSDFGIAVVIGRGNEENNMPVAGTKAYIAPEQILGHPQPQSDQYALGIIVYEWLCGFPPFSIKDNPTDVILEEHMYREPPSLSSTGINVSPEVEEVIKRVLAKDPRQRFVTVSEFAKALEEAFLASSSIASLKIPFAPDEILPQDQVPSDSNGIVFRAGNDKFISDSLGAEIEVSEQSIVPEAPPSILEAAESPVSSTLLFTQTVSSQRDLRDFFIIYTKADRKWAKWVAWKLEEARHSVILSPWHLHSQSNFDMEMAKAEAKAKRTIIILSPDSLKILKAQPMYIAMLQKELTSNQNKLLSICVRDCGSEHEQLLDLLHHIDIVGEDELTAREILLASVQDEGISLTMHPAFPDTGVRRSLETEPTFPPDSPTMTQEQVSEIISFNTMVSPTLPLFLPDIEIFFSYSHKDKRLRDELERFMHHLKRHPSIKAWHDGEIVAGMVRAQEIDKHLRKANIILLLVSQDFIVSNFCDGSEMQKAIQRHEAGEARVIPIILRHSTWADTSIGELLQPLPTDAKPIMQYRDKDRAWVDVVRGIQRAIEQLADNR